jgi:hypothetical protein
MNMINTNSAAPGVQTATPAKKVTAKGSAKKSVVQASKPATSVATVATKASAKVSVKASVKAPAKTAAKTITKPATKSVTKSAAKPEVKSSVKTGAAVTSKILASAQPKVSKPLKAKKPKLVRDSFTIPKLEYLVMDELKQRATKLAFPIKKSELLRAGIKSLAAMSDQAFITALKSVPAIKTGRPAKD